MTAGVRRFKIFRPVAARNHVWIDLELESLAEAEALVSAPRAMWDRVEGTVVSNAKAQILERVEDSAV
jgi:hypothetical protein